MQRRIPNKWGRNASKPGSGNHAHVHTMHNRSTGRPGRPGLGGGIVNWSSPAVHYAADSSKYVKWKKSSSLFYAITFLVCAVVLLGINLYLPLDLPVIIFHFFSIPRILVHVVVFVFALVLVCLAVTGIHRFYEPLPHLHALTQQEQAAMGLPPSKTASHASLFSPSASRPSSSPSSASAGLGRSYGSPYSRGGTRNAVNAVNRQRLPYSSLSSFSSSPSTSSSSSSRSPGSLGAKSPSSLSAAVRMSSSSGSPDRAQTLDASHITDRHSLSRYINQFEASHSQALSVPPVTPPSHHIHALRYAGSPASSMASMRRSALGRSPLPMSGSPLSALSMSMTSHIDGYTSGVNVTPKYQTTNRTAQKKKQQGSVDDVDSSEAAYQLMRMLGITTSFDRCAMNMRRWLSATIIQQVSREFALNEIKLDTMTAEVLKAYHTQLSADDKALLLAPYRSSSALLPPEVLPFLQQSKSSSTSGTSTFATLTGMIMGGRGGGSSASRSSSLFLPYSSLIAQEKRYKYLQGKVPSAPAVLERKDLQKYLTIQVGVNTDDDVTSSVRAYVLTRIRQLAAGDYISSFVWDGGASEFNGEKWDARRLPTDTQLMMHLFVNFMNQFDDYFSATFFRDLSKQKGKGGRGPVSTTTTTTSSTSTSSSSAGLTSGVMGGARGFGAGMGMGMGARTGTAFGGGGSGFGAPSLASGFASSTGAAGGISGSLGSPSAPGAVSGGASGSGGSSGKDKKKVKYHHVTIVQTCVHPSPPYYMLKVPADSPACKYSVPKPASSKDAGEWRVVPGRSCVFHVLTLFVYYIKKYNKGRIGGVTLDDASLNHLDLVLQQ